MKFLKQLYHSFLATIAIVGLVVLLFLFGIIPYDANVFGCFLIGAVFLVVGQAIFLVSIDESVVKIGKSVGTSLMAGKNFWVIILFGFLFGLVSTIAEPDVQVLIGELLDINPFIASFLLLSIFGIGSGLFVSFAILRILKNFSLKWTLLILYAIIIVLASFCPEGYLGLSFDAGGVATGSITVPFLLTLIIGICAIRGGSKDDSFGAVAITSTGPIIAVLILGIVCGEPNSDVTYEIVRSDFFSLMGSQLIDVSLALAPLLVIFIVAQFFIIKLPAKQVVKILVGFVISAIGLVLFLTGIYFGFTEMGKFIGEMIMLSPNIWFIFLFGFALGLLLVFTDPATIVLVEQVESVTSGYLKRQTVFITLGIGVALAIVLSFVHSIYSISLWYLLIPFYIVMVIINFFIPKMFVGIAFDGGGISAGTMTVAFILPICCGICANLGNDLLVYGFGVTGLVSTIPIFTIQVLGLIYVIRKSILEHKEKKKEELKNKAIEQQNNQQEDINNSNDLTLDINKTNIIIKEEPNKDLQSIDYESPKEEPTTQKEKKITKGKNNQNDKTKVVEKPKKTNKSKTTQKDKKEKAKEKEKETTQTKKTTKPKTKTVKPLNKKGVKNNVK